MNAIYQLIGRWLVGLALARYRRQIRIALGVGIAGIVVGGYLAATRQPPEG